MLRLGDSLARLAEDVFVAVCEDPDDPAELPIDAIKIDQPFTSKLSGRPRASTITNSIFQLAHALGMMVLAEDVETAEQRRCLTRPGFDAFQGFIWLDPRALTRLMPPPRSSPVCQPSNSSLED